MLSKSNNYEIENLFVARNLDEAIDIARQQSRRERLFVIGGGSVYEQTYTLADELYLTQIQPRDCNQKSLFDEEFYGDTFFPKVGNKGWELCHVSRLYRAMDSTSPNPVPTSVNYYFRFFKYGKKSSCGCTHAEKRQVQNILSADRGISFPLTYL